MTISFSCLCFLSGKEILLKITNKLLGKVQFHFTLRRYNKPVWNSIILWMKSLYEIRWWRKMRRRGAIQLYDNITQRWKIKERIHITQPRYRWESLISSVQFSRSVVADSLQPHESQHARPPKILKYGNCKNTASSGINILL